MNEGIRTRLHKVLVIFVASVIGIVIAISIFSFFLSIVHVDESSITEGSGPFLNVTFSFLLTLASLGGIFLLGQGLTSTIAYVHVGNTNAKKYLHFI